jgi:hypothetical protein
MVHGVGIEVEKARGGDMVKINKAPDSRQQY